MILHGSNCTLETDGCCECQSEELRPQTENEKNGERWHWLALVHGYNELTRLSETLAEKVYLRIMRDQAEEEAAKAGVTIHRGEQGPVVLELRDAPPFITFHERDIELMRASVAKFDIAHAEPDPQAAPAPPIPRGWPETSEWPSQQMSSPPPAETARHTMICGKVVEAATHEALGEECVRHGRMCPTCEALTSTPRNVPQAAPQRRAIDLCACNHIANAHQDEVGACGSFLVAGNCGCRAFTPHPQPGPPPDETCAKPELFMVERTCCGRSESPFGPAPYDQADSFRESYLSGPGVAEGSHDVGHRRSAIIVAVAPPPSVPASCSACKRPLTPLDGQHFTICLSCWNPDWPRPAVPASDEAKVREIAARWYSAHRSAPTPRLMLEGAVREALAEGQRVEREACINVVLGKRPQERRWRAAFLLLNRVADAIARRAASGGTGT